MLTAAGFVVLAAAGTTVRVALYSASLNTRPATLAVNAAGALALGWLSGAGPAWLTAVGVGGLGALTTYSGFNREIIDLLDRGRPRVAFAYAATTLVVCTALAWLGLVVAD